jgi:indolepyruvate ferredoxin oxidoreductase beta subunit
MQTNIILAGVGGQGILSIAVAIDSAALKQGLRFKQAEVHGMSQRGGDVQSHLRLSSSTIHSDLVPRGGADLVLSTEPLESLRYVEFLRPQGALVTSVDPFINISNYPELEKVLDAVATLPSHTLIHADALAREAGSGRAQNMVMLGAASPFLGVEERLLEDALREAFARKGEKVQQINVAAYRAGKAAGESYRACLKAGIAARAARELLGHVAHGTLETEAIAAWKSLLAGPKGSDVLALLAKDKAARIKGAADLPKALASAGSGADLGAMLKS